MLDNILQSQGVTLPWWVIGVMLLGSFVDICQFFWIIKRNIKAMRRRYYQRLYDQARLDVLDKIPKGRS